jgi:outer membrane receptor protein involved in Fe transport
VNNIFDKMPPLTTSGDAGGGGSDCPAGPCNGNTWPGTYDALGRYLYAGITLDF